MTGYIFLLLAVLCGSTKGFAGKKSSGDLDTLPRMLRFGAVRTAMCALLSLIIWLMAGGVAVSKSALAISVVSGISMSVFLLTWIAAVRGGAYVRLDVCCQTGMVIPCIFAAPLLGERVSAVQYICLGALVIAIVLLSDRGKKKAAKMKFRDIVLLVLVWLSSGVNCLTVKLYANACEGGTELYNLVTFAVAAIAFAVSYFAIPKENKVTLPKIHYTLYLPIMAAALYLNIFFQAAAAKHLDAMIMFPLQTVLGLVASAVMAAVFFGEKPTVKNIVGMVLAAAAIVAM